MSSPQLDLLGPREPEPGAQAAAGDHLAGLTPSQREAVVHDAGPLVVLAGPGTGKTRVIIHRILHLLRARDAKPEQIVAITFTVKAAAEMRERLAKAAGSSVADCVNVHTFHGLGRKLIHRFPDLLGMPRGAELIDSAQRRAVLRDLILKHNLLPESAGSGREAVLEFVERCLEGFWNHAITPEQRRAYIKKELDEIDNALPLWAAEGEARRLELDRFEDVAKLADLFDKVCRERAWCSMGELLALPTKLLAQSKLASSVVRSDWRHFIVDEYQDVNGAQIELLRVLAPPAGKDEPQPDLCVVGDDDQAIYEFRGADDRAFHKFTRIWEGHATIALADNFRSGAPIIAVANDILTRAPEGSRYRPDKIIRPGRVPEPSPMGPAEVQAVKLPHDFQDADAIAAMVLTQLAKHPEAPLREMAVIARGRKDLERVAAAFQLEGIPYWIRDRARVTDDAAVQDVLAWIELLVDLRASWVARRVLMRPPFSLPGDRVTMWERAYRAAASRFEAGAPGAEDPGDYIAWLHRLEGEETAEVAGALLRFFALHKQLREDAASKRADDVIFRIMMGAGVVQADLPSAAEHPARVDALVAVLRFARARQTRIAPPGDLAAFWAYYQDLEDRDRDFGGEMGERLDTPDGGENGTEDAGEQVGGGGGVQLVTAHSAKGLEFDTVFVTRITPSKGFPTVKDSEDDLPERLVDRAGDKRSSRQRREAEERRLFYVACTRAKRRLVLLAKWNKSKSTATHYFEELFRDRHGGPPISVLEAEDVLSMAVKAGAWAGKTPSRSGLDREALGLARLARLREAVARARSEARGSAAEILDRTGRAGATKADLEEAGEKLRIVSGQLGIISAVESGLPAPEWIGGRKEWKELDVALREVAQSEEKEPDAEPIAGLRAVRPPLMLSQQKIRDYLDCPRCYYVKHELHLPEPSSPVMAFGNAAHVALNRFYKAWSDADNLGEARPGVERLVEMGREEFFRQCGPLQVVDRHELRRLEKQLGNLFAKLHLDSFHILECEKGVEFPYPRGPHVHTFSARLDRLDQIEGGFRLVDYKTGEAKKYLTEPAADDLQLGIYAMAIAHLYGAPATGVAEYWVLSTGQRGVIKLEELDLAKVRKKIDKAIDGILSGDFHRGSDFNCKGMCAFLGA